MSHDQTKDETFNQKYAGRSRVRRDLNTIKRDVVAASVGTTSGNTNYFLSERLGNTMNIGYVQFGPGYGTTVGTGPEKDRLFSTWSSGTDHQVCLWRGPRDNTGATDTSATGGTIFVHKVATYGETSLFDNTGTTNISIGPGGFMSSGADPDGMINDVPVQAASYFQPAAASQSGDIQKDNLVCSWTDNDDRGDGAIPASGGYIAGSGTTGGSVGGGGLLGLYNHGLWLHANCGSGDPADWTTGKLEIYIFYTMMPD